MDEVIEISEDSIDCKTQIAKNDGPVVYTLDDSLSFNPDAQQVNYPSSPTPNFHTDDKSIEIIESNCPSSEIVAPFCHELSNNTGGHGSSPQISSAFNKRKPNAPGDKLLDKIVGGNSSPDSSVFSEKTSEDAVVTMADMAAKWSKPSSRPITKADQLVRTSQMANPGASQDVLENFPLSSPITNRTPQEENKLESQQYYNNADEHALQPSPVRSKSAISPQVNETENKIDEQTSSPKIRRNHSSRSEVTQSANTKADIVELNLSKFLSDRTWEDTAPSSRKRANRVMKTNNSVPYVISNTRELEKTILRQYILRGKYYTQQESEALLRYWLKEDKERLKQANQIYRSNENARSSIIVEMPSGLLESFQETTKEIETLISPATLQVGYDNSLPRVRFLRRFTSIYDFNHDIYYPGELKIMEENVNILFYDAQQFFESYRSEKRKLYDMIQSFSKDNKYLIVILSDLNKLKRSVESLEDIKYKAKVQEKLTGSQFAATYGKRMGSIQNLRMKTFDLEQRLRHIDRLWNVKLHVVNSTMEFISTLPNLVSIIGRQRMDPAIRFMKYSHLHVRSSKDKTDALKQTFHHINKMPELKSNSVTNAYPDFQSLFSDFRKGQLKSGYDGKHLMTEAMESRLYKLFTCQDPHETIQ